MCTLVNLNIGIKHIAIALADDNFDGGKSMSSQICTTTDQEIDVAVWVDNIFGLSIKPHFF